MAPPPTTGDCEAGGVTGTGKGQRGNGIICGGGKDRWQGRGIMVVVARLLVLWLPLLFFCSGSFFTLPHSSNPYPQRLL